MLNKKINRNNIWPVILLVSLLFSPASSQALAVTITGRVFTEDGPLAGAVVSVYKTHQDLFAGTPFLTSGPTDIQGLYALQVEQGEYYFIARGSVQGRSYFAYHGGNPLRLGTENTWLSLMALEEKTPVYSDGSTAVKGIVTYKGKPVKDANIAFYSLENSIFKGLGFLAGKGIGFMATAGKDGTFDFSLKPNQYVVIARKTQEGRGISLLKTGELYCYYPSNPIEIKPDKSISIEVPCYPKADRLSFVGSPKIKANNYPTVEDVMERAGYGIKGKVTDVHGNPMPGMYVIAYRVDSATLTHESQDIAVSDDEGNYFIRLDRAGSYGLVARNTLGRAPNPDDLTGLHNRNPWQGISFKAGQVIEDVNITIRQASEQKGDGQAAP